MPTPDPGAQAFRMLTAVRLSPRAFAPYGDVIESSGPSETINQGMARRYGDLARVDLAAANGRAAISRVACEPEPMPVVLRVLERHPLGSQAFIPLDAQRYIVVVAPAGATPRPETLRAFVANGDQGVNYHRGIWHHPMIALDVAGEFLEVHRVGSGGNCDEVELDMPTYVRIESDNADARPETE